MFKSQIFGDQCTIIVQYHHKLVPIRSYLCSQHIAAPVGPGLNKTDANFFLLPELSLTCWLCNIKLHFLIISWMIFISENVFHIFMCWHKINRKWKLMDMHPNDPSRGLLLVNWPFQIDPHLSLPWSKDCKYVNPATSPRGSMGTLEHL